MREIEFRGYSTEYKKWIYGYLTCNIPIIYNPKYGAYDVDKKSVGQYTGLKDKNGKKIFEGDILEDGYPVVYGDWNCGCCADIYGYDFGFGSRYNLEVIGNIYENPELLKENS